MRRPLNLSDDEALFLGVALKSKLEQYPEDYVLASILKKLTTIMEAEGLISLSEARRRRGEA